MKRFTLSLLVLTALALHANTPPSPDAAQVMRYQCVAGTVHGLTKAEDRPATFRIDTATGKTWMLQAVPMNTPNGVIIVSTWIEVHETNGELYRVAMQSMSK
jgi:hypothetical protein